MPRADTTRYTQVVIRLKRRGATPDAPPVVKVGRLTLREYSLIEVIKVLDLRVARGSGHSRFWDVNGKPFDVEPVRWDHVSVMAE